MPDWVDKVEAGLPCAGTAFVVLLEEQRNHLGPQLHEFIRVIYRMRNDEDVKDFMLMRFPLGHDRVEVVVHTLSVYRGAKEWRYLDPSFTKTTPLQMVTEQVESGPSHVVKGTPPALLHRVTDLKVGDYLEVAHTKICPIDPALAGVITGTMSFCREVVVQRMRLRLLLPHRRIKVNTVGVDGRPRQRTHDAFTELLWACRDVPVVPKIVDHERRERSRPHIQYSEFASWDAAAALLRPLYECADPPPEIAELADAFARAHPSKKQQILAVMRHVQDEFAYELYDTRELLIRPKSLARILAERATDCKGKTMLMLSLLRALGVEATAVFVNRHGADPSGPLVLLTDLDHVIVMVTVDGRDYFIDPSRRRQRGDLDTLTPLEFHRGLALTPHRGLVEIPHHCDRPVPQSEFSVRYKVGAPGRPSLLDYRRDDRGQDADTARTIRRDEDPAQLGRRLHNTFTRLHPGVLSVENVVDHDDEATNTYRTAADIRLSSIWLRDPTGDIYFDILPARLLDELFGVVETPLLLHHREICFFMSWSSTLQLPFIPRVEGGHYESRLPGLELRCSTDVRGTRVRVDYTVKLCCLACTDVDAVLAEIKRIPTQCRVRVRPPVSPQTSVAPVARVTDTVAPDGRLDASARPGVARPFRPRFR